MNIQNTSSIYSNIDLLKKWNTQDSNEIYQELKNNEVSATSITFENYSNLTTNDIDKLFPEEVNAQENYKAHALHTKANGTTSDILNQILFERELAPNDDKYEKYANKSIGARFAVAKLSEMPLPSGYIERLSNNGEIRNVFVPHQTQPISRSLWTPDELFESFRLSKEAYEENYPNEKKEMWEASHKVHTEIEREYYKRLSQINSILSQYTNNNKPNTIAETVE